MLLSCPNCGTVTEIADVLIPSARLTATCCGCGGKIGGTVPARLETGTAAPKRGRKGRAGARPRRRADSGRPRPELKAPGFDSGAGSTEESERSGGKDNKKPPAPAEVSRPSLGTVAQRLDPERLAGLVAADMLLYNREKIQEKAAEVTLLSSMATEIVEAWEFYKKRVGVHTALGTSYFRDALNNVLSGGDPVI